MMQPAFLTKGDCVAIVAPSRVIYEKQILKSIEVLKDWGLDVILSEHLYSNDGYFAGNDEERASDFQYALDNAQIKAIFCARGGYGMTRILDTLDWSKFSSSPKWIVGFSDITALHLKLNRLEVESIHGLMPVQFEYDSVERSLESLKKVLFEANNSYTINVHESSIEGKCRGQLIGGNLSLICDSLGTSTEIITDDKVLFIEEIDEYLYKLDRMLTQLNRSGKLSRLKGVIVGNFSKTKDTEIPFGKTLYELILSHFSKRNVPVIIGFPAGHEPYHLALPLSRKINMEVSNSQATIHF